MSRLIQTSFASLFLFLVLHLSPYVVSAQWAAPDAWPQFRGNPLLTGVSKSDLPKNLRLLWTYEAGEAIESSAAIADGTVFVGTQKGELVALDLGSGSVRWKYTAAKEGIGESSPAVANGVVYVGDLAGVVHAVGARDGRGLWTLKTGGEIKSSPVIVGDRVLVGSYDQHLYCLSAARGELLWKLKTNGPVHSTGGVANGLVFVAGCDEIFRGVRISDGREEVRVASGAYTGASPALMEGNAFYGTFDNEVLGVSLSARRIRWRYQNPERRFPYYSSAAAVEGRVVVGGRDKMVHCINAGTGKSIWTFATRARVDSSPALASGRVFVGSNDGRIYELDFYSGAKLGEFNAGAPVSASPAIASGRIVVGAQDGRLYCFG
ncbi:MAG TPA: PQQ-binding-like beta-propeller repeat protein [Pyrinomonadaceae bacterium]|jgi:outer membrane protein assembly factor BamB